MNDLCDFIVTHMDSATLTLVGNSSSKSKPEHTSASNPAAIAAQLNRTNKKMKHLHFELTTAGSNVAPSVNTNRRLRRLIGKMQVLRQK